MNWPVNWRTAAVLTATQQFMTANKHLLKSSVMRAVHAIRAIHEIQAILTLARGRHLFLYACWSRCIWYPLKHLVSPHQKYRAKRVITSEHKPRPLSSDGRKQKKTKAEPPSPLTNANYCTVAQASTWRFQLLYCNTRKKENTQHIKRHASNGTRHISHGTHTSHSTAL